MDSGKLPMEVKCPNCKKYVVTKTKIVKNANMSFCICCCCCLPCCIHDNIVTVLHLCPNCKALISFDSEINTWALCLTYLQSPSPISIRIHTFGALFKSFSLESSIALRSQLLLLLRYYLSNSRSRIQFCPSKIHRQPFLLYLASGSDSSLSKDPLLF